MKRSISFSEVFAAVVLCLAFLAASDSDAASKQTKASAVSEDADNSKVNKRDRNPSELTAIDQSNDEKDVEITRQIRQALMKQDDFSVNAQNIKIITADGVVTLKGPVHTREEKAKAEKFAKSVAGVTRVKSELRVER